MITRQQAIIRLIGSWCSKVIDDPDYGLRVTLADVLTHEAIEAVRRDDLLADHDPDRRAALIAWRAHRPSWERVQ